MQGSVRIAEEPVADNENRWLTVAEVAEYLQLSRAKIYELAQTARIPCSKVAGQWRFKRREIDDWMLAQRDAPAASRRVERTADRKGGDP
jgi:excisionase family DNA binding protein